MKNGLTVTDTGRLLIRNIAMRFDAYQAARQRGTPPTPKPYENHELRGNHRRRHHGPDGRVSPPATRCPGDALRRPAGAWVAYYAASAAKAISPNAGPNTILETSPKISALIRDLGLEDRKLYSRPGGRQSPYLVRGGKMLPLPDSLFRFLGTPLFSASAKLRLLAEPFIGRAPRR